jgi:uncharacterized protein
MSVSAALVLWASLFLTVTSAVAQSLVEAPGPSGPLKGTMLSAVNSGGPVVLIIPGSGPTDRDGNSPLGIKASTYRLLAEGLAENGITSVRIDKRGMHASAAAVPDADAVTIADYATDVYSWVAAIRERTGQKCVWLLGHSEGGLVAEVAVQHASDVCGLLLVASLGRPLGQVLRAQLKANPANAPVLEQALSAIDSLEAGRTVDISGMNPALLPLFRPQVQKFLISAFALDPAELLRGYRNPILILQGQYDLQVDQADARLLSSANPNAKLVLLPKVNHVLKSVVSADRAANVATYVDPSLPLAPGVIDAIVQFVTAEATKVR